MKKSPTLNVFLNQTPVGELRKLKSETLEFQYSTSWLKRIPHLAISRCLPLQEAPFVGDIVHHYFANLLPESALALKLLVKSTGARSSELFDVLTQIGKDCVGALRLLPDTIESNPRNVTPISDKEIANRLTNLKNNPLGMNEEEDFRISLAGMQEKMALYRENGKWYLPHGANPTTHIIKPPIGTLNSKIDLGLSVENEWLCLKICSLYELPVAEAEIIFFDGIKTLVVTRFDRAWENGVLYRIPQEDFCQALGMPPEKKYQSDGGPSISQIMDVLLESTQPEEDRKMFMKAQVVFWLLAAIDGHAKNFSITMAPHGFTLAPLYDVLSVYPSLKQGHLDERKLKMAMSVGDKRYYKIKEIYPRHWLQTAKEVKFSSNEMDSILEQVAQKTNDVIQNLKIPHGFPSEVADPILLGMQKAAKILSA